MSFEQTPQLEIAHAGIRRLQPVTHCSNRVRGYSTCSVSDRVTKGKGIEATEDQQGFHEFLHYAG